jgi:hypothetical protein
MPRRDPELLTGGDLAESTFADPFNGGQGVQFGRAHGE